MSWVDGGDYFGPDRRNGRRFRLIERRRNDSAYLAPSLASLLRKLQFWARDASAGEMNALERYRARVQTVAKLAHERGELGVEAWLHALDQHLDRAPTNRTHGRCLAEICNQHLQRAISTLG